VKSRSWVAAFLVLAAFAAVTFGFGKRGDASARDHGRHERADDSEPDAGEPSVSPPSSSWRSRGSLASARSIGSIGSYCSIGSIGSSFSIGSVGSFASVGSILCAGSLCSFASVGGLFSTFAVFDRRGALTGRGRAHRHRSARTSVTAP